MLRQNPSIFQHLTTVQCHIAVKNSQNTDTSYALQEVIHVHGFFFTFFSGERLDYLPFCKNILCTGRNRKKHSVYKRVIRRKDTLIAEHRKMLLEQDTVQNESYKE
jgi:hypothetical protein